MLEPRPGEQRISDGWWTAILVVAVTIFFFITAALFAGTFRRYVPVTLTSERSGLVMENGAKVKMRGVQVGRVGEVTGSQGSASLRLEIDPDQIQFIPANVSAQIKSTTAFGAKFVDLVYPSNPTSTRLAANAVLTSSNVTTEVNTVFENVVNLLDMIEPQKLNAVLTAIAEGVRGQGPRMGQATTDLNVVLKALNERSDIIREDWRSFKNFNDTYAAAAEDIVTILDAGSTLSTTIADRPSELDALLLNTISFSDNARQLLEESEEPLVRAINTLRPTTALLNKYNPVYTCWFKGAHWTLTEGGAYDVWGGGDGRTAVFDAALLFGNDPYQFPDNLPIVKAKGGPGGQPGCGSLPDASENFPVRQLVTNTGWGTGLDIRPNPGIGHPCWGDWFPVTRAVPERPSIRQCLPGPAPGPDMGPGMPPYGAAWYGPGGQPLWPGVPPAPAPAAPPQPAPSP